MEKLNAYLIDSDILIDYLRGFSDTRTFLFNLKEQGYLMISTINVVEIYSGRDIKNSKKRKIIDDFINEFKIIPLEEDIAKQAGIIRMKYQTPFADAIIAATAINSHFSLVTKNIKHFSKIKGLKLKTI